MIKKLLLYFSFFIGIYSYSQVKENLVIPKNPKIGLSLSGGGAKGFSHIGVLKVLDSMGVKIDYISGTSMGAIVGGLYASGYSATEIEKLVLNTDFFDVISNEKTRQETSFFSKSNDKYLYTIPIIDNKINVLPQAISSGQKNIYLLKELFKNVSNIDDFSKLPIPFMCMVTNLETGKLKILERGDLVTSIMASSAFPSLMNPVKVGDSVYIDGAITLNYPSKPLLDKGMDIVIGVDLSQGLATRDQLTSVVSILNQVIDMGIQKETINQYNYTDINIHPNLGKFSATSFGDKEAIIKLGFDEAKKYIAPLSKLPKSDQNKLRASNNSIFSNVYKIDSLVVENNNIYTQNYIRGKMGLKLPSLQTYSKINAMINKLYATNNFNLINYDIIQEENLNYLKVVTTEDPAKLFLKFGLHYDEVFKTGLLLNASAKRFLFRNSDLSLDLVIGDKPRYYLKYFVDNGYIPGFGINSSGMTLDLKNEFSETKDRWNWFRNEIFIQSILNDRYAFGGGLSYDYFESRNNILASGSYVNPYAFLKSDTQDDSNFPTKGIYLNAEGKILDLLNEDISDKDIQAKAHFSFNIPISEIFTFRMNMFGGFTIGESLPEYYKYRPGGIFGQSLNNFTPFAGLQFGEYSSDQLLTSTADFQIRAFKNIFFTGSAGILNEFNDIKLEEILRITNTFAGVTAGYKSPVGQIKINYSQPLNSKNGTFNIILGHWF
ncbi:patatin-like phospholipase family protein [Frigoriflavimonas asaccharolytica]|uniref:NTE family protein n=1 Tax=Frigoriflavimonas asaccharolytica TaxID=2735899 RepID=A0A8J8K6P4_9FLAO|nr:patatin-like phospholipase family protein [Frigoriflavimonas asaccharolytica]NRS91173.1 NTE family protein [Frigoriflavimonas asaccharolytica]